MQTSREISGSGARENILRRIDESSRSRPQPVASVLNEAIFIPSSDPRQRFLQECAGNLTEVYHAADRNHSAQALELVLSTVPAGEVYLQDHAALQPLITVVRQCRSVRLSSQGVPAENTQASLTAVHAFVAQTGSILTSSTCGGRGASIVPPCHIVYGRGEQIVADIAAALALAKSQIPDASYVGLITGSSRTADIEKIVVQGAHGPRRLIVILEG